jgi:hypothetical protein
VKRTLILIVGFLLVCAGIDLLQVDRVPAWQALIALGLLGFGFATIIDAIDAWRRDHSEAMVIGPVQAHARICDKHCFVCQHPVMLHDVLGIVLSPSRECAYVAHWHCLTQKGSDRIGDWSLPT